MVLQRFSKYSAMKENILNQKWSTDITYIHTEKEGWTYLASVEDLYLRKIIDWAFGKTIDKVTLMTIPASNHSVLKKEEVNLRKYKDSKTAYDAIFEYIESWYNRKRIHSNLNYRTPKAVYSECEKLAA